MHEAQDSSTWQTDGNIDMCPFKPNALRGKGIKVWCEARYFSAETANGVTVEIVSGEKQNVEMLFFSGGSFRDL